MVKGEYFFSQFKYKIMLLYKPPDPSFLREVLSLFTHTFVVYFADPETASNISLELMF